MNIYEEIIQREKIMIRSLKFQLENNTSPCVSCTKDAIAYHEKIIDCIRELQFIKEHEDL